MKFRFWVYFCRFSIKRPGSPPEKIFWLSSYSYSWSLVSLIWKNTRVWTFSYLFITLFGSISRITYYKLGITECLKTVGILCRASRLPVTYAYNSGKCSLTFFHRFRKCSLWCLCSSQGCWDGYALQADRDLARNETRFLRGNWLSTQMDSRRNVCSEGRADLSYRNVWNERDVLMAR